MIADSTQEPRSSPWQAHRRPICDAGAKGWGGTIDPPFASSCAGGKEVRRIFLTLARGPKDRDGTGYSIH